jgi:hypothetical protein
MNTNVLSQTEFAECVSNTVTINRQRSTLSDPFEFGLYVRALQIAQCQADDAGHRRHGGCVWHKRAADIMRSKKLTLADFCKAIGASKCDLTQNAGADIQPGGGARQIARPWHYPASSSFG